MSKKDFSQRIKETVQENVPQDAFAKNDQEQSTSRWAIKGTKGLKGARSISIAKIHPDPDQPRKIFYENSINELADSIKAHGVLQPITVEYLPSEGTYKIIAGERRFQASKIVGLTEIPCVIHEEVENNKRRALQLVENLQREDLSPIDKARAILIFKDLVGSWEEVDRLTGLSTRRRQQFTALLKLPTEIQAEITDLGRGPKKVNFTEKHARALLVLKKYPEKQKELFRLVVDPNNPLPSNEALEKAKEFKGNPTHQTLIIKYTSKEELINKLEQELEKLKGC